MVGVIVLNFNTADDVIKCVGSIRQFTKTAYQLYIVDNCSTDNSYEVLLENFKDSQGVVLLKSEANDGFSAGNNIGIKRAIEDGCSSICLINADIVLLNDAITILEDKLNSSQGVGVVAPSIASPNSDEEAQFARNKLTFGNFLSEKTFFGKFKSFEKKHPRYQVEGKKFEGDYAFFGMTYGCMYLVALPFFEKTGLLDDVVFLFNEEDIIAHKLEKLGLKTLITPSAKVLHNHHSSISKTSVANRVFHFRVSELIVLRKYDGASALKLLPVICIFNFVWLMKSIASKDFRSRLGAFIKKTNGVLKIKKGSGLKNIN